MRMRAEYENHIWGYGFVEDRLSNGRKIRFLSIIGEYGRTLIACVPRRSWKDNPVIDVLHRSFPKHGTPGCIKSDNGSKFAAHKVRDCLTSAEVAGR